MKIRAAQLENGRTVTIDVTLTALSMGLVIDAPDMREGKGVMVRWDVLRSAIPEMLREIAPKMAQAQAQQP